MPQEDVLIGYPHGHAGFSDHTQEKYLGLPGNNHRGLDPEYVTKLAETVPDDVDIFFSVTNHFENEGEEYWKEIEDEIEDRGGDSTRGDFVLRGALKGTRIWGIQGVEAAYKDNLDHEYLMHGLRLDDDRDHTYGSSDEILEATEQEAAAGVLPHPFMMDYDWGEEKRESFFDAAEDYSVDLGVEHPLGYGLLNNLANGKWLSDQTVPDISEKYEVPAVPGHDVHAYYPRSIATLDRSAIDSLEEDRIPVEEMLDMSVAYRGSIQESIDTFWDTVGAGLAFNDMIPGSPLPNTESFYQKLTEWSLKNFEDLSAQEIHENSMRLNGEDGLLAQKF